MVKLDGWSTNAQHNMFNGLKWGPDGWLWGCNGILSMSRVGKPGTPDDKRVAINCGVWRYHPTREVFEAVAHGTTNPWGLDFDDLGEAFITNCVIPHLFHVVPGAHFQRMFGEDVDAKALCADGVLRRSHPLGGRALAGLARRPGQARRGRRRPCPRGGDDLPGRQLARALSQRRLHVQYPRPSGQPRSARTRAGSSYVARHEQDFLMANDTWFRGLELKYGPDGAVYLTDWYDTGECHETDADNAHRENGRIYKISYGTPKPVKVDLAAETTRRSPACSFTPTNGMCARRAGCSRNVRLPGKTSRQRKACSARS